MVITLKFLPVPHNIEGAPIMLGSRCPKDKDWPLLYNFWKKHVL
jgi:hypothetical protein